LLVGLSVLAGIGCQKKTGTAVSEPAPTIPVSLPVEREVTDYMDYTGRTDAVQAVNVRARATGFLNETRFEEGAEVKEGDLLFKINPDPYDIAVAQAKASIDSAKASLKNAEATLEADKQAQKLAKAVSDLTIIADEANVEGARARLDSAKESLRLAELNLSYCNVYAQVSGQISRYYYTPGNLITQDQTLLTTIVSIDSMYAYFDIEQRTFDRIEREISANKNLLPVNIDPQSLRAVAGGVSFMTPIQRANFPVLMSLEGQPGFPHRGKLDFINNQVNPSTGTVAARGYFKNERLGGGLVSLIPGMFVRVRLPLGASHKSQLIIDRAINSDQGIKYVYVVDADNRVQYRRVIPDALQEDGLRVIKPYRAKEGEELESGIKTNELVVVGGLQQLKPRMEIKPNKVPMPTVAVADLPKPAPNIPPTAAKGEKGVLAPIAPSGNKTGPGPKGK
jgi:multidrug efflux system membrane fusion protein